MKVRGFTLIEMVLTMVVGVIMVLAIAGFVESGTKGYADSINRQRVQTQAQFILEKLSREFRDAVPNSFQASGSCLSFIPIHFSGIYSAIGQDIDFLVGANNDDGSEITTIPNGLSMVINPTRREDLLPINTFDVGNQNKNNGHFTLVGEAKNLVSRSIADRHYIFDPNDIVEYCVVGNIITRQSLQDALPLTVADSIVGSKSGFKYLDPTLQRGGLVHIDLVVEQNSERSVYQQDVQVLNVP